jgi:hypothetical protein
MADYRDPDKEELTTSPTSTMTASTALEKELEEELHTDCNDSHASSVHDDSSNRQHSIESGYSLNPDPLTALELAISSPNQRAVEEMSRPYPTRTATSIGTTGSRPPDFEVDFEPNDPDNPRNWPLWYRGLTIATVSYATWTVVLYSTSYTSSMPGMMKDFDIDNEPLTTLGITFYLIGLAIGSLLLAPASEIWGRRPVYVVALLVFCILVIPCALATSLPEVLVVRLFGYAYLSYDMNVSITSFN